MASALELKLILSEFIYKYKIVKKNPPRKIAFTTYKNYTAKLLAGCFCKIIYCKNIIDVICDAIQM